MSIPAFGLGTFRLTDEAVIASVKTALELGYRVIDTAQIYGNEAAIGEALAQRFTLEDQLIVLAFDFNLSESANDEAVANNERDMARPA